jgi:choline dehydrogenase-like flavoprotein
MSAGTGNGYKGDTPAESAWDYVIVGSGAGGGTLAARLAESGMRVFLLEAGSDCLQIQAERLPDDYSVPCFHAFACENPAMKWDFDVRHYANDALQQRDSKYDTKRGGVLYPRAATLGGCTAHNAMIFMLAHDSDWNHIRQLTGDESWSARRMHRHARRLEACHYRPFWRVLRRLGLDPTGHGWDGWLHTERPKELQALGDEALVQTIASSAVGFARYLKHPLPSIYRWLHSAADPNARPWRARSFEGLCYTPLSTAGHQRMGTRERLLDVAKRHPGSLHIELDALAVRILFDSTGTTACGVEYLKGRHLYRAHASPSAETGLLQQVRATREVILAGGAFNTPQLLMLSGIGPAAHLRAHDIPIRVPLPGVGQNLQDRYEVAVTHRMRAPWQILHGARFERGDPVWQLWHETREGLYASNGVALAFVLRSQPSLPEPDIFCMALPTLFRGYFRNFSRDLQTYQDRLTWAVLKAHTNNRAGTVTLRSKDATDPPVINFHYFDEGTDTEGRDLEAVVEAIRVVRGLTRPLLECGLIAEECLPGPQVQSDAALADYVRANAWGHHASCSCPIGSPENGGVVDSRFAVHGTRRLRIVDASIFPRIPGFFLVSAVYMIAEKAAQTLLDEVRAGRMRPAGSPAGAAPDLR